MPARYDCEERICSILSRAWNTPFTSVSSVVGQRHGSGHEIYRTVEIMGWRVGGREGGGEYKRIERKRSRTRFSCFDLGLKGTLYTPLLKRSYTHSLTSSMSFFKSVG